MKYSLVQGDVSLDTQSFHSVEVINVERGVIC